MSDADNKPRNDDAAEDAAAKNGAEEAVVPKSAGDDAENAADAMASDVVPDAPASDVVPDAPASGDKQGDMPALSDSDTPDAGAADAAPAVSDSVPHPPPPFPFEESSNEGIDDPSLLPAVTDDTIDDTEEEDEEEDEEEEEEEEEEESPMTLVQHLDELRKRLKYIALAAIVGCLACYGFAEELFNLLVAPMVRFMPEQSSFIFTAPQEAFLTYLKVAALAGIFLTSPYIFYQVWAFIAPGLYEEERKYIVPVAVFSALFFVGGASFGYFVVFPAAFEFFMSFNNEHIQAMLKLDEYLSFSIKLLLAFGFVFEMPLFALVLSRIGILTADMMRKVRRFAVLGAFVVGAILTPPDVFSQLLMAGPLLVLYEVSIIVASVFGRKKEEPSEEDETEEDEDDEEAAEAK
ncbi:twin-arginine translocase subunit TatC [Desulfovibrio subterraneus]|uniref:twin-arginine translocase subunit TatC n=1 Tax=Desulfovibrio subterraneus TaxID=2718620 RepID=UPI0022B8C30A|nr:twin-arginine translocase subunit TatC [Desulfovibrio subterraneus]WBF67674.1 twin-arginine translocase subunit TatC [Desulfovibrio subterraneus]